MLTPSSWPTTSTTPAGGRSYLAKDSLFKIPVLGFIVRAAKQIPVVRGSVDAARALDEAISTVKAGGA